jgi:hypothetical protein
MKLLAVLALAAGAFAVNDAIVKTIWDIAHKEYGLNDREVLATFETCLVESDCENLNYGDKDSLGIWQQRPSMGWCPDGPQQCRDVVYSTHRFLDVLVKCSAQHPGYSAGQIAQCTQVSEIPDAYDRKESQARSLVAELKAKYGDGSKPATTKTTAKTTKTTAKTTKTTEKATSTKTTAVKETNKSSLTGDKNKCTRKWAKAPASTKKNGTVTYEDDGKAKRSAVVLEGLRYHRRSATHI